MARPYGTLRLEGHEWRDATRLRRAWERDIKAARRSGTVAAASITSFSRSAQAANETSEPWRLWLARPDRMRAEFRAGDETVTAVFAGVRWWSRSPNGFRSNDGDPRHGHGIGPGEALLEPARHLEHLVVRDTVETTFLSRPVRRMIAEPRPWTFESSSTLHRLGAGGDRYELVLDVEAGVLLRTEARLEGAPFRVIEVDDVRVNETLDDWIFDPDRLRAG